MAAEKLGLSGEQSAGLRQRIDPGRPEEAAYAIRRDLPANSTETLLIVDQFEELFTLTPHDQRTAFVNILLELAKPDGSNSCRVLLTMRSDYLNLCRQHEELRKQLGENSNQAVYRLERMSKSGLADIVAKPLQLAGHTNDAEQHSLIDLFHRDVGDLALIEMALFSLWRDRKRHDNDLVNGYVALGGISGALAHKADAVRTQNLNRTEQSQLLSVLVRLVKLGDTRGATRRPFVRI